MGKFSDIACTV